MQDWFWLDSAHERKFSVKNTQKTLSAKEIKPVTGYNCSGLIKRLISGDS
jgi:hypothetical protein